MTHEKEIKRWAECPNGTKVWYRDAQDREWKITRFSVWSNSRVYIVDDEYAEVRKFFADNGFVWYNCWYNGWAKADNPDFSMPIEKYATSKPDEEVYYYKWKKELLFTVDVSGYTNADLSKDGYIRIDESKSTFDEIKG